MSAAESQSPSSAALHRRETRLYIYLPAVLLFVVLLIAAGLVAITLSPPEKRWGLSLIADLMLTVLVLCPSVICLGAVAVGMAVLAVKIGVAHETLEKPLRRAQRITDTVAERSESTADAVNHRAVMFSARMAFFSKLLSVFDRPEDEPKDTNQHG